MYIQHPKNVEILQYQDKADNCFSVEQKEIQCPKDRSKITLIEPQI